MPDHDLENVLDKQADLLLAKTSENRHGSIQSRVKKPRKPRMDWPLEVQLQAVEMYRRGELSGREAIEKYNLSGIAWHNWKKKYEEKRILALRNPDLLKRRRLGPGCNNNLQCNRSPESYPIILGNDVSMQNAHGTLQQSSVHNYCSTQQFNTAINVAKSRTQTSHMSMAPHAVFFPSMQDNMGALPMGHPHVIVPGSITQHPLIMSNQTASIVHSHSPQLSYDHVQRIVQPHLAGQYEQNPYSRNLSRLHLNMPQNLLREVTLQLDGPLIEHSRDLETVIPMVES